jgi:hypothetical protein
LKDGSEIVSRFGTGRSLGAYFFLPSGSDHYSEESLPISILPAKFIHLLEFGFISNVAYLHISTCSILVFPRPFFGGRQFN